MNSRLPESENLNSKTFYNWLSYENRLDIDEAAFKYGILRVKVHGMSTNTGDTNTGGYKFNSRVICIYDPKNPQSKKPNSSRPEKLALALEKYSDPDLSDRVEPPYILYNEQRREEIFLPFQVSKDTGLLIYPWVSSSFPAEYTFDGFEHFVTAGCLFGSSLKGMDQYGGTNALIKHEIRFFPEQKFDHIVFESESPNPYEQMLFSELKNMILFINKYSKKDCAKTLTYHLPYYDYILFGIELFISGRISLSALDSLFMIILERRDVHSHFIHTVCEKNNIKVLIESPFDNLFGSLTLEKAKKQKNEGTLAKSILSTLELPEDEILPTTLTDDQKKSNEAKLVNKCLGKLCEHTYNDNHRAAWNALSNNHINNDSIQTLEDLFKLANATMIAIASNGKQDFKTCSILPLSEKQIQVSYQNFCKKENVEQHFPAIFNATILDPLITYAPNTQGLPFYFSHSPKSLSDLIINKGLLKAAHKNITLFGRSTSQIECLNKFLTASSSENESSTNKLPNQSSSSTPNATKK